MKITGFVQKVSFMVGKFEATNALPLWYTQVYPVSSDN